MIVDVDPTSREFLADILRESGYLAFGVAAAAQGLDYLRMGLRPCAILVNLDDVAAMRFRAEQVADRRLAGVPVIVGSRLGSEPRLIEAESAFDSPAWLTRLLGLLGEYCSRRRPSARAHLRAVRSPRLE